MDFTRELQRLCDTAMRDFGENSIVEIVVSRSAFDRLVVEVSWDRYLSACIAKERFLRLSTLGGAVLIRPEKLPPAEIDLYGEGG